MLSLIREPPTALYVIDGEVDVRLSVPPGHVALAFRAGRRPRILPLTPESIAVEIESDCALGGEMPIVLCLVPVDDADRWLGLEQSEADALHGEVIEDWARGTCMGSA